MVVVKTALVEGIFPLYGSFLRILESASAYDRGVSDMNDVEYLEVEIPLPFSMFLSNPS